METVEDAEVLLGAAPGFEEAGAPVV